MFVNELKVIGEHIRNNFVYAVKLLQNMLCGKIFYANKFNAFLFKYQNIYFHFLRYFKSKRTFWLLFNKFLEKHIDLFPLNKQRNCMKPKNASLKLIGLMNTPELEDISIPTSGPPATLHLQNHWSYLRIKDRFFLLIYHLK